MKNLFFSAMLAVIAVGGALTSKAGGVYFDADNQEINCTGNASLCSDIDPAVTLWTEPNQQGQSFQSDELDETNKFL